jgi:tetratricopeptide (TPR) repeat protein
MTPARQQEEEIFEAAVQLPPPQRAAYLETACGADAVLRERIEHLLSALERANPLLKEAPPSGSQGFLVSAQSVEKPGDRIGRYKLLEQIGEGGCGVVYVAEQEEPVRRRVALKIIKLGMDTKQVIARFDAERQALAMMDHPNIAKIHDAGATETGRPYFVMELVRGVRITDYCDQNQLPPRERLDLFIQICRAIQHAHQKGVIHRDIKPSNILVTVNDGVAVPKVIDFGIAKATQGRLTDQTVYTAFEQFIGTPAYMSPEQASMTSLDIDTRSDIYSLGVLLYELLTGKTPFDAKELLSKGLDEMRRTIREVEPVKPSTRLTKELAGTELKHLINALRGDLDWIVMKCLDKDRGRRYETANGLARDIERHLRNEPVSARPPSALYRFQKAIRRNKTAFGTATGIGGALLIGMGVSTSEAIRAARAQKEQIRLRQIAVAKERKSDLTAKFLTDALFAAGPAVARGRDATVLREILEKAGQHVASDLKDEPEVQGDLWFTIGMTHWDIGDHPRAITNLQHAVESYRLAFGDAHPKLALALTRLGWCESSLGDVATGKATAELGLEMVRHYPDAPKETLAECLVGTAHSLDPWGLMSANGLPYMREAVALREQLLTNRDDLMALASLKSDLSMVETNDDRRELLANEALALHRQSLPPGDLQIAKDLFSLGQILLDRDKNEEAEAVLRETDDLHNKVYDKDHPRLPIVRRFLIEALGRRGKWEEAETLIRSKVQDPSALPEYWIMLVRLKAARGDLQSAIDEARRARAAKIPAIDYEIAFNLAVLLLQTGQHEEYRQLCHELIERTPWADFRGKSVATEIALLLPVSGDDFDHACQLADRLATTNDATASAVLASLPKALAEYHSGRNGSATNWTARAIAAADASDCNCTDAPGAQAWFLQASALARLTNIDAARAALLQGDKLLHQPHLDFVPGHWGAGWGEWAIAEYLGREAHGLVEVHPAAGR